MNIITLSAAGITAGTKRTRDTFNNSVDTERSQTGNVRSLQGGQKYATRRVANHLMDKSAQEQLQKFVEDNILSRDCTKYIPQSVDSPNENLCCCGYSKQWHVKRNIDVDDGDGRRDISRGKAGMIIVSNPRSDEDFAVADRAWDENLHIGNFSSWCYGVIQFSGFPEDGSRYPVPYVRISTKSSLKPALKLLTEHWLLRRPKLVVSILGSDDYFFKREKERTEFKKAVIDMIQNTGGFSKTAPGQESELSQGAWVITNGFGSGITQCVAEALNEYAARVNLMDRLDIAIIGVCHWGSLDGTDMLTPSEKGGLFPAKYEKRVILNEANRNEKTPKTLDYNHTHFILYDNGKGYDDKQTWRGELESFIASELLVIRRDLGRVEWLKYPAVRLLVNGDAREIETAKRIYESVPRFKIPLLILNDRTQHEKERTKENRESMLDQRLAKQISARNLVTTYVIESESGVIDLKELIRNAIFSSNIGRTPVQEVQGLIAAGLIRQASEARDVNLSLQKIRSGNRLNEFLMYSLINKQHEVVELILNSGADLEQFLTITTIKNLYLQILDDADEDLRTTFLRNLVKNQKKYNEKDEWKKLQAIGLLLSSLMGHDTSNNNYTAPWIGKSSTEDSVDKQGAWENVRLDSPHKHLMLWAILFNLDKMALLFWRTGENHIGCALLAANLSKNLAKKADHMEMDDFVESYNSLANTFEYQATNVLHNCYLQNTRLTELCLIRSIHDLGHSTALSLAHDAELTVFMEHESYQQQLDSIWNGSIAPKTSLWKLAVTSLFPFILIRNLRFVRRSSAGHGGENVLRNHTASSSVTMSAGSTAPDKFIDTVSVELPRSEKSHYYGLFAVVEKPHRKINYGTALQFFFCAPATKFLYTWMFYFAFLVVLSIFILHEFTTQWTEPAGKPLEIVLWISAASLTVDAVIQQIMEKKINKTTKGKSALRLNLKKWWTNLWNILDISTLISLIISIILRFTTIQPNTFDGRMAYAVCASLLVIRSIRAFRAFENLGPKLIILRKMIFDVMIFTAILSVFLVSFGISYRALEYPKSELNGALLANIFYNAYFIIFGQVPIEEIVGGTVQACNSTIRSSTFGEGDACPQESWLADLYLALYCFIANILLINLLIAMFNFTFKKVQKNSTRHWRYQRFSLVREFYHRPAVPAPFNLPFWIHTLNAHFSRINGKEKTSGDAFERNISAEETRQVLALERRAVERVTDLMKENSLTTTERSSAIQEKLDKVLEDAKQMKSSLDSRHRQMSKMTQTDTLA